MQTQAAVAAAVAVAAAASEFFGRDITSESRLCLPIIVRNVKRVITTRHAEL